MADIFLSYARADQPRVEKLAAALEEAGYTLWWDKHLRGGHRFSEDIEAAIAKAKAVLVVWSKNAVKSEWVRDEAAYGRDHNKLVPTRIDDTLPPMGYRQRHAIELSDPHAMVALTEAIDALVGGKHEAHSRAMIKTRSVKAALLAIPLLAAVGGVVYWAWESVVGSATEMAEQGDAKSLAILPFEVDGSDELAFLGPGLAGTLTSGLELLPGLRLTALSSTKAVAERGLMAREIGQELGVGHFVEGSLQPQGADTMRLDIRLIDARSESQLWTASYAVPVDDLAQLEARVGADLAAAIQARLGVGQGAYIANGDINPRAYQAYLKGVEGISRRSDPDARREALRQFRLAASIAPDFADAHAGVAYILSLSRPDHLGEDWDSIIKGHEAASSRALENDPTNLLARVSRAQIANNVRGEIAEPQRAMRELLEEAPDFAPAHYMLGNSLAAAGNYREAILHYDRAIGMDPFNSTLRAVRQGAYYLAGDYEQVRLAALECKTSCEQFYWGWFDALGAYGSESDFDRDWPKIEAGLKDTPGAQYIAEARNLAQKITSGQKLSPADFSELEEDDWAIEWAAWLAIGGREADAFEVARRFSRRGHADTIIYILTEGRVVFPDRLRADPRYLALFDENEGFRNIERYRRTRGILHGLPIRQAGER